MKFKIEQDLKKCQGLWEEFSPKQELFDEWEYRDCFYQAYGYQPYFIVGSQGDKVMGVLPLWYEERRDFYTFFGGTFPEPNTFFVKNKADLGDFLKQCPPKSRLYYLDKKESKYWPLEESDKKYFLNLKKYEDKIENYWLGFDRKHRKNLRYDLKQFEKLNYSLRYNHLADFEKMVELNRKRFGKESDFEEKEMRMGMKNLMEVAEKRGELMMISLLVEGRVEAVEMVVIYKNCYYVLASGHNLEVKNIGKKMMVEQIKKAMEKRMEKIDFLSSDSGWKKMWHLESVPLFEFKN